MEMEGTVFSNALDVMKDIKSSESKILTKPFLDACKKILPVIDKFGAAMTLVRNDIGGNIERLEEKYATNKTKYQFLHSMVEEEVENGIAKKSTSCTNGLLWLTRAMDFIVHLFQNLLENPGWQMKEACTSSYEKTLKKWHGWLASSTFTVAMKLAPDRKKFTQVLGNKDQLDSDIRNFCTTFSPFLQENHAFLKNVGMEEMKAS